MPTQQATEQFELRGAAADAVTEALPRPRRNGDGALADGLGWFSLGLGVAEVAAPGLLARLIGLNDNVDNRETLRAAGLREIASGVGILTRDRRAGWVWARVGGDVMDLALLGSALVSDEAQQPRRLAAATAAVAGVTALDVFCVRKLGHAERGNHIQGVTRAITVNRPPREVYDYWHNLENLPRFMEHVEAVRVTGPGRSHWVVRGPVGTTVEWDAEIVEDRLGELVAWRSIKGADVENSGSVRFRPAPGGRGTELVVELRYAPIAPIGGALASGVASLFGESPEQQLEDDLRRFKQVVETGEIARSEASESLLGMGRAGRPGPVQPYEAFARGER